MIARALVAKAVDSSRRMSGAHDTLDITRSLIDSGVILGDDEAGGESAIIRAIDNLPLDAPHAELVDAILRELGYEAAV